MFAQLPREHEKWSWSFALVWAISIFCFIPIARTFQRTVEHTFGREAFLILVFSYLGLLFVLALLIVLRQIRKLPLSNMICLIFFLAIFCYWSWQLRNNPERALHFVQYGTLSILLYRALLHRFRDRGIYLISIALCFLMGTIDETIQWLTPERFFDYDDILIDGGAAILMQLALATGIRPTIISNRFSRVSLRTFLAASGFQCFLLALCLANTPSTVKWYTAHIPMLSYLKEKPNVMSEYGYRYYDSELGTFFSRLRPAELKRLDHEIGQEAGELVLQWYDVNRYHSFLHHHPAHTSPLPYELRVRLFRRDAYWNDALKASGENASFREAITIAYLEHRILDRYYPVSYQASQQKLTPRDEAWMERNAITEYRYISPVGGHLLTYLSQSAYLFILTFCIAFILWILNAMHEPSKVILDESERSSD